ncbi:MAG: DUF2019 domain-containing protein [Candidatus Dormibacteraeota bacterium]|nr:DUF2019 domain-containing protein [Candidatus Dormibacteraeota bacterium]
MDEVDRLGENYRGTLLEMDSVELARGDSANEWNRLVNRLQALQLELRQTLEGRRAITALVADGNVTVRGWSAAHALLWDPGPALAALQEMAASDGRGRLDAEMTIKEYRAGRLKHDWTPTTT